MKKSFIFSSLVLLGLLMLISVTTNAQSVVPKVWLDTAGTYINGVAEGPQWFKKATTGNNVRGMAYNPVTNHVLVPTRDSAFNCIMILDATNGDTLGRMNMTGVTGGTFAFNRLGVSSDGRIYTANLVTSVNTTTARFKIYTWADETSAPVVAFNDSIRGPRLGDALTVVGSGENTYVYASGNANPGPVHIFKRSGDTLVHYKDLALDGWGAYGVLGIGPTTSGIGDFWVNTSGNTLRKFDSTGAALDTVPGTIIASGGATAHYFEHLGKKFIGVYSGNTTPSVFRIVDVTDGGANSYVAGITASLGTTTNANGTGEIYYHAGDSSLYALATNNGVGRFSINQAVPIVTYNTRAPFVPNTGENDTVYVNILSLKPLSDAKIAYYGKKTIVSDQVGDDSARVTLDQFSGRIYRGVIPGSANRDGRRVNFKAEVTDHVNVMNVPAHLSGYFAGITKMALKDGPRDIDTTTGAMLYTGYGVRAQGICTQEDSLIAVPTSRHDVIIQDNIGAVDVIQFAVSGTPPPWSMKRGREYRVAGLISQYNGKMQIGIPGATGTNVEVVDLGPAMLPAPAQVTVRDLAFDKKGELLENALVRISNLYLTPGSLAWPSAGASGTNITVTDNGIDSMTLRVPALSSANGFPPKQPFTVIGLAGQFDNSSPFTSGYQVIMRMKDDLISEIHVGVNDTTSAPANSNVTLPVNVGNISGLGITAYQFTAKYDSTALQFLNATINGTLSEGYAFQSNVIQNGWVEVAASGVIPLQDSGVVFNYQFKILKTGASTINLTGRFNEGNPLAIVHGGVVVGGALMESEPNDSMSVANPVMLGEEIHGNLSSAAGDPDFFSFDAPIGHLIVDVTDASDATDADIYLYNAAGTMLYNVDRNSNDRLEYNITTAGKYYVKVAGYLSGSTYATGPYKMLARIGTATDPNEPNDGPLFGFFNIATPAGFDYSDTTNTLDPGVGIPGNDYDYFRVIAGPGQTITAVVQGKSHFPSSTLNSIRVRLFRKGTFPTTIVGQDKTDGSDVTITHAVAIADTYFVRVINLTGAEAGPNARYKLTIAKPTGVLDEIVGLPTVFALEQNYPNPFNPSTAVRFALPSDASVRLTVYDILGREVRMLVNEELKAGYHLAMWDGKNNFGTSVSSGVYIYRIEAGSFISTKKMMLMK